jgi:hypothetical protein
MIVPGDKAMSIILGALGIVFINRKAEGATPVFVTSEGSELK